MGPPSLRRACGPCFAVRKPAMCKPCLSCCLWSEAGVRGMCLKTCFIIIPQLWEETENFCLWGCIPCMRHALLMLHGLACHGTAGGRGTCMLLLI